MRYRTAIVAGLLLIFSCKGKDHQADTKAYAEHKRSLAVTEQENPAAFLSLDSKTHKNLIGQTVIKGTIYNKATVTAYKNIRLKFLFYDASGKETRHHEDAFEETIKPGGNYRYKSKFRPPGGSDSCAVSIMSAEPIQ
jgi:hypothetical protein